MPTVEELIAELDVSVPVHGHHTSDYNTHLVVDPTTRDVFNDVTGTYTVIQFDHNSERITFEAPRFIDGHDMMLCDRVKVHYINIQPATETTLEESNSDVYEVDDLRIDPADPKKVLCTWLIARQATQLVGPLNFLIQYACSDGEGNLVYEWHSGIYVGLEVKEGMENGDMAVSEYTNILEQWYAKLFGAKDSILEEIVNKGQEKLDEIQAKGDLVLDTIPEDYTTTSENAKMALATKADAIILKAVGDTIVIDDASDNSVHDLLVFGKTRRVMDELYKVPVLVSITNPTVKIYGRNFVNASAIELGSNTSINVSADGYNVIITGGATEFNTVSSVPVDIDLVKGKTVVFQMDSIVATKQEANASVCLVVQNQNGFTRTELSSESLSAKIEVPDDVTDVIVEINTNKTEAGLEEDNLVTVSGIRLFYGECDWEQYKPVQSITINRTFNAVPVTSHGNYVDDNGQQWYGDYVHFKYGKFARFVQNIYVNTFDGSDDENWLTYNYTDVEGFRVANVLPEDMSQREGLCDRYDVNKVNAYNTGVQFGGATMYHRDIIFFTNEFYDESLLDKGRTNWREYLNTNPVTVMTYLTNPIITEMTDAERKAFEDLHTNATDTVVVSNNNAGLWVEYVADLKRYIYKNYSTKERAFDLTLPQKNWTESVDKLYYYQVADFKARPTARIDLHPTPVQLIEMVNDGLAMFLGNENGVVTAYCIGGTPGRDFTIRASEQVVVYE